MQAMNNLSKTKPPLLSLRLKLFSLISYKQKFWALFGNKNSLLALTSIDDPRLTEKQWQLIRDHLPDHYQSFVDIGAWRGYFSFKMLAHKPDVSGTMIEASEQPITISAIIAELVQKPNLAIYHLAVTPENCQQHCSADISLLLSVYHQWHIFLGEDKAFTLLKEVWKNTKQCLFFSMSDSRSHNKQYSKGLLSFGITSDEILEKIKSMLMKLDNASVVHLGDLPYWAKNMRKGGNYRHIFKVVKQLPVEKNIL